MSTAHRIPATADTLLCRRQSLEARADWWASLSERDRLAYWLSLS